MWFSGRHVNHLVGLATKEALLVGDPVECLRNKFRWSKTQPTRLPPRTSGPSTHPLRRPSIITPAPTPTQQRQRPTTIPPESRQISYVDGNQKKAINYRSLRKLCIAGTRHHWPRDRAEGYSTTAWVPATETKNLSQYKTTNLTRSLSSLNNHYRRPDLLNLHRPSTIASAKNISRATKYTPNNGFL